MGRGWTPTDKAAAVKRIGLELPPSAVVKSAAGQIGGPDDGLRVVATMSAADWTALQPTIHASDSGPVQFSAIDNSDLEGDDGWVSAKTPGLTTAQLHWRGSEVLNLGVAPEAGGRVRLFVFWYQT